MSPPGLYRLYCILVSIEKVITHILGDGGTLRKGCLYFLQCRFKLLALGTAAFMIVLTFNEEKFIFWVTKRVSGTVVGHVCIACQVYLFLKTKFELIVTGNLFSPAEIRDSNPRDFSTSSDLRRASHKLRFQVSILQAKR